MRSLTPVALELIRTHEALELTPYRDGGGVWTVGWGHTGPTAQAGKPITVELAQTLLAADLRVAQRAVERLVTHRLTDNQYGALVSFTFNVGTGRLQNSTLRRCVNAGLLNRVAQRTNAPAIILDDRGRENFLHYTGELMRWIRINGKVSRGLIRRRADEAALWCAADGTVPIPPPHPSRRN